MKTFNTLSSYTYSMNEKNFTLSKQIGNIIISNLLEKSPAYLHKYIDNNIKEIKALGYYQQIIFKQFSDITTLENIPSFKNIIASIKIIENSNLLLLYNFKNLSGNFSFNNKTISLNLIKKIIDKNFKLILYRFRRINFFNKMIFIILQSLLYLQKEYFLTGKDLNIKLILLSEIENYIKKRYNVNIDISLISRFIQNKSLIDINGVEVPLTYLCSNKRLVYMKTLSNYFEEESEKLITKQIKHPLSDADISSYLLKQYNIKISRRQIAKYRNILGIENSFNRVIMYNYTPHYFIFSPFYEYTKKNIKKYVLNFPGLYEIHISENIIKYHNKFNTVIYIGSTKNLRKRLIEHLNSKNILLKNILSSKKCKFRFLLDSEHYHTKEKILLKNFYKKYRLNPICNKIRY